MRLCLTLYKTHLSLLLLDFRSTYLFVKNVNASPCRSVFDLSCTLFEPNFVIALDVLFKLDYFSGTQLYTTGWLLYRNMKVLARLLEDSGLVEHQTRLTWWCTRLNEILVAPLGGSDVGGLLPHSFLQDVLAKLPALWTRPNKVVPRVLRGWVTWFASCCEKPDQMLLLLLALLYFDVLAGRHVNGCPAITLSFNFERIYQILVQSHLAL